MGPFLSSIRQLLLINLSSHGINLIFDRIDLRNIYEFRWNKHFENISNFFERIIELLYCHSKSKRSGWIISYHFTEEFQFF